MTWKDTASDFLRKILPKEPAKPIEDHEFNENECKANLPLQMAAYFNVTFLPVWVIVLFLFILDKYSNFGNLVQVIIVTVMTTVTIVEAMRLYMVYEGNLKDKIPELAGFWMLSVFLQLPLQGLLLFNPYFQLGVLETVCQAIMFILLTLQIVFGYLALKYTASQQARFFRDKHESFRMRVLNKGDKVDEGKEETG